MVHKKYITKETSKIEVKLGCKLELPDSQETTNMHTFTQRKNTVSCQFLLILNYNRNFAFVSLYEDPSTT